MGCSGWITDPDVFRVYISCYVCGAALPSDNPDEISKHVANCGSSSGPGLPVDIGFDGYEDR